MTSIEIGDRIRRLRTLRNMTQEQLAHFALKSERWLRYVEGGRATPDIDTAQRLALALRVQVPVVLGLEPLPKVSSPERSNSGKTASSSSPINRLEMNSVSSNQAEDSDLANMEAFRIADRQLGGGHLYKAVTSYIKTEMGPNLLNGTSDKFVAAASLTEMAGWMAHEAGDHRAAGIHFDQAWRLAQAGNADDLAADVAAARAHLSLHLNDPNDALQIAQLGQVQATNHHGLKSRLYVMEATATAVLRNKAEAVRLLHRAEAALIQAGHEESSWISPYDEASLAGEAARCLHALGDLPAARQAAERVIVLRPADRVRSRAFAQLSLALIVMAKPQADVTEACIFGMEVIKATRTLASARVLHQLDHLKKLLAPHCKVREVADFLLHLDSVLPQTLKTHHHLNHGDS